MNSVEKSQDFNVRGSWTMYRRNFQLLRLFTSSLCASLYITSFFSLSDRKIFVYHFFVDY